MKDMEAHCIFNLDLEVFLQGLSEIERIILLKKLEGFSIDEIGEIVNLSRYVVTARLKNIGLRYCEYSGIGLA